MNPVLVLLLSSFLFSTLSLGQITLNPPRIRYVNSMPQFGSAGVTAVSPPSTLFTEVLPGAITNYTNFNTGSWNFWATFDRKVKAGSDLALVIDEFYYSVYTYQTGANSLQNQVLLDPYNIILTNVSGIRTVNLAQYNYPINVTATNASGHVSNLWNNLAYGQSTSYSYIPPGEYTFSWVSASLTRRNIAQNNCSGCVGGGGHGRVVRASSYTFWVLPTTVFLTGDATLEDLFPEGRKKRRVLRKSASSRLSNKELMADEKEEEKEKEEVVEPAEQTEKEN